MGVLAPVIKLEFEGEPYQLTIEDGCWLDGTYEATAE